MLQMEELQLFRGDTVRIKGKRGRETVCIVLGDVTCDNGSIRINKVCLTPSECRLFKVGFIPPSPAQTRRLCVRTCACVSGISSP